MLEKCRKGLSLYDTHQLYVDQLKKRGEPVVQPKGEPSNKIYGYVKSIGLKSAGSIFRTNDSYGSIQDLGARIYQGIDWDDLGLCDAKCWYEATNSKDDMTNDKKVTGKTVEDTLVRPTIVISELCINVKDGQAILRTDNSLEFVECLPIALDDLERVVQIAKDFIEYKQSKSEDVSVNGQKN